MLVAAITAIALAGVRALVACSEITPTTFGNPNTLDRKNLPGEGGVEQLVCGAVDGGDFDGGCPSFATDIYPYFAAAGTWRCSDKACHGGTTTPPIDGTNAGACLASLKKIAVKNVPYVLSDGGKDPNCVQRSLQSTRFLREQDAQAPGGRPDQRRPLQGRSVVEVRSAPLRTACRSSRPNPRNSYSLARVNWRARIIAIALAVLFIVALSPTVARAGDKEDSATIAAVDKIVRGDVAQANFGEAKKKLRALLDRCKKGCSSAAVAQVHMAVGLVSAQIGQADDAKTAWFDALNADANVQLPATGVSPAIRQQWEQTQKAWLAANPQPDDAQKAGWVNKGGYELSKAAVAAEVAGNFADCIEKDKAALLQEENMRARLHLALCEAKAGKIVDALRDNSKALESARAKNDAATLKQVQERVTELLPKLAHVTFQIPTGVTELRIVFDDRPIPPERAGRQLHDRSRHAQGPRRGRPARRSRLLRRREGGGRRGPDREREDHAQAGRAHRRAARVHGRREDAGGDPPVPSVGAKAARRASRARRERLPRHHRGPRAHAGHPRLGGLPHRRMERRRELPRRRRDGRVARRRLDRLPALRQTRDTPRPRPAATSLVASAGRSTAATRASTTTSPGRSARR